MRHHIIIPILTISVSFSQTVPHHGSGTYLLIRRLNQLRAEGKSTALARTAAQYLSGRTFLSPNFAIHYTLAPNVHRPRLTTADSSLRRRIDSILAVLPSSLTTFQRDSAVNGTFPDSVAPAFVVRAAYHFERTRSYYGDSLGMLLPTGGSQSRVFSGSSYDGSRYTVDICDISTAEPDEAGPIYGLTWPGPISTELENDFIYEASYNNSSGQSIGSPIQAIVNGRVLHDYAVDWDMAIKVTVAHEFSHAVHFTYIPDASNFHDWYELSATAMEEILGPEVNDYFQYLPCIFQHPQTVPLFADVDNGVCNASPYFINPFFGQGIFAQYLYHFVNKRFDAVLWDKLRSNGNNLSTALAATTRSYGKSWDSVYSAYTALFATAGRSGSAASCTDSMAPIFTRDMPCWPVPVYDSVPTLSKSLYDTLSPLTFRLFKPPKAASVTRMDLSGLSNSIPQKVNRTGSTYNATALAGNPVSLFASSDSSVLCMTVPNSSFTQNGRAYLTTAPQGFVAFPNPANISEGQVLFFAPSGSTAPITLTILSESGRRVAELALNSDQSSWTWDLKDQQARTVPPGVYYYRIPGKLPKSMLVLPR